MIEPISKKQIDNRPNGQLIDECIGWINDCIISRNWHDNFADPKEYRDNYYAIIISPHGRFNEIILDEVVKKFNAKGWQTTHKSCYDARGPHHCFYVSKNDL